VKPQSIKCLTATRHPRRNATVHGVRLHGLRTAYAPHAHACSHKGTRTNGRTRLHDDDDGDNNDDNMMTSKHIR
jgi:hypothetical protein